MAFNTQKPNIIKVEHDFGLGDGPETVFLKTLSPEEQKRIFTSRMRVTGKQEDGNDQWGLIPADLQEAQIDAIVTCVVDSEEPTAKRVFTKKQIASGEVNMSVVEQLSEIFSENVGFFGPDAIKRQKEAEELVKAGEDPPRAG